MVKSILGSYSIIEKPSFDWQKNFKFYRFMARNHNHRWKEGIYSRLVYNPAIDEYCVQVVSYYRFQLIPFHINDYHPFYAYFDGSLNLLRLLYDQGHHISTLAHLNKGQQILTIIFPWHPFEDGKKALALPLRTVFAELSDTVLLKWWLQPGMPQFKLRSKFVDPWHPGLMSKDKLISGTFRDEIVCPSCGKRHLFDAMDYDGKIFSVDIPCCDSSIITAIYDPEMMKMEIAKINKVNKV